MQEGCPFIVCMTYAFQTPEKLCFILDLMNGGDLHYHLSQHGVFSETEVRFYCSEIILGLEHMHNRFVVYRDLKVTFLRLYLLSISTSYVASSSSPSSSVFLTIDSSFGETIQALASHSHTHVILYIVIVIISLFL